MRAAYSDSLVRVVAGCSLMLGGAAVAMASACAGPISSVASYPAVTNLAQLRLLAIQTPGVSYSVQLEGNVWWVNPAQGRLVLQDSSGAAELEMNLPELSAEAGQRVRLTGNGTITRRGPGYRIGARGPVVDNDGVHSMEEKSGAVYLKAGQHPIRLEWFNGVEKMGLEVDYEGPSLPRQRIPEAALYRIETNGPSGYTTRVQGLSYRCFEGNWEALPDFSRLNAVKTGRVADFNLDARSRDEHVGIEFIGHLEVPRAGVYWFYTKSDDGSRLFVGEPSLSLEVIGPAAFPEPRQIPIGQILRDGEDDQWVAVEGKVTFVRKSLDTIQLDLSAGAGRLRVEIADASGLSSALLMNCRIRVVGFCQGALTSDGQRVPGILLTPTGRNIDLLELPPVYWACPLTAIRDLAATNVSGFGEQVVHLRGTVRLSESGQALSLADGTGEIAVETTQAAPRTSGPVEVLGELGRAGARLLILGASFRMPPDGLSTNSGALSLLTTASEVHRLKREYAERGYPARIRGVITCVVPDYQAFVIQDATRGLYVEDHSAIRSGPPQIGECLEIEGFTDPSKFAPIINARRVTSLGAGQLPEPLRPTWDQLVNGSLDAQYVEIQGMVTGVETNQVTLRTRGGMIKVELRLSGMLPEELKRYENALIRVRGCLLATWDYVTHQVNVGEIRIYDADITVDQPAPMDLFLSPSKTPAELLLFDPQAGVFERVKVSGQIVYVREPEYFMMQGGNGLRFIVKQPAGLQVGDQVEVVGFPEISGSGSPVLREGVVRKTGHASLPEAKSPRAEDLMRAGYDATRVRVEGKLVSVRKAGADQVLEMQNGVRSFVARLQSGQESVQSLAVGSVLELVGVYAGQGGNRAVGQDIASFELLLNSPADIKLLARPPWWTLERLLVIVGALACVLAATVLWITQLHRQVEERTAQLEAQIQERQRVEHQRAMEQERARIAQDLHDELGSGLTEISMLGVRAKSASVPDEKRNRHLEQVGAKAREMVAALDEIVWAMNPRHDSLASLVSYFCLYADRFLGLANIAWRLEESSGSTDHAVDSRHRHQLFLAFKEALTNVVRHSGATEVRLKIQLDDGQVRLTISDNGRGLPPDARTEEMDGVANMKARLEKLGGRFEMASEAGRGTILRFYLPSY
jgi:signal transduction histidine kinase